MHVIVVGAGITGLSTAWALAKRGHRVTVLERDAVPNRLGASGDQHRIIRRAYGKMHGYTRRMSEAFDAWDELWRDLGHVHVVPAGFMGISRARGDDSDVFREGLAAGGYPFETLSRSEALRRFPFLQPDGFESVFVSSEGGVLLCREIAAGLLAWLRENGVAFHEHAKVQSVDRAAARVVLADGTVHAGDAVVVAAGAWVTALMPDLASALSSRRTYVVYLEPPADLRAAWQATPSIIDVGGTIDGYVLPPAAGTDLKFGAGETRLPWTPETPVTLADDAGEKLRDLFGPPFARLDEYRVLGVRACVYTFTEDSHFFATRQGAAWLVSACSGHGYKFGPAVGRHVAQALESGDDGSLRTWIEARD